MPFPPRCSSFLLTPWALTHSSGRSLVSCHPPLWPLPHFLCPLSLVSFLPSTQLPSQSPDCKGSSPPVRWQMPNNWWVGWARGWPIVSAISIGWMFPPGQSAQYWWHVVNGLSEFLTFEHWQSSPKPLQGLQHPASSDREMSRIEVVVFLPLLLGSKAGMKGIVRFTSEDASQGNLEICTFEFCLGQSSLSLLRRIFTISWPKATLTSFQKPLRGYPDLFEHTLTFVN